MVGFGVYSNKDGDPVDVTRYMKEFSNLGDYDNQTASYTKHVKAMDRQFAITEDGELVILLYQNLTFLHVPKKEQLKVQYGATEPETF